MQNLAVGISKQSYNGLICANSFLMIVEGRLLILAVCCFTDKALMAPNLDSFGRDRALYQEHAKRRIAEREARR